MAFLEDIDKWMFGDFRANRQRTEERHGMDMKRMQALLESEQGRTLMNKARAASLNRGEGLYGGRGVDPYVKGAEDLGKIRTAKDRFAEDELSPETAAYFTAAEKSVLDRLKVQDNRDYFAPGDETDVFSALGKPPEEIDPIDRAIGKAGGRKSLPKTSISDYFQAPTDTVPESKVPKSYPQLGITNVDDQATLEEIQKALPDINIKDEYEADPESMQKLIQLWKEGKLNKQNIHKAFSMIQQTAQQALGLG